MSKENILKVLVGPHMSEKASNISEKQGQYTFKVLKDANKRDIKSAIEMLFSVKVHSVQTLRCVGKQKRKGKLLGRTNAWKKAYVQLQEGEKINFSSQDVA